MGGNTVLKLVYLARINNAVMPLLAFGIGLGFSDTTNIQFINYCVFLLVAVSAFATLQNDLHDKDVDMANGRKSAYLDGSFKKEFIWHVCLYLLVFATVCVVLAHSILALFIFFVSILLSIAYNSKPLQLSRRPISSIAVLAIVMAALPVTLGLGAQLATTVIGQVVILGVTTQRFSLSILKDYKDYVGDKKLGKRTFLVAYGALATKYVSVSMSVIGYTALLCAYYVHSGNGYITLAFCAAAVVSIGERILLTNNVDVKHNNTVFRRSQIIHSYFEMALIACLFIF